MPVNAIDVIATFKNVDMTTLGSGVRLGVQLGGCRRATGAAPTLTMLDNVFLTPNNLFPELVEIRAFAERIYVGMTCGSQGMRSCLGDGQFQADTAPSSTT